KQAQKLPPGIIGIKRTENVAELADIYSSADIFLNPTLEDNFPTTNLEALACGTPIITFNAGGSPEALDDKCGCVVETKLEAIVTACLQMGKKTDNVRDACIDRAKLFDENLCFEKYLDLYERNR
ncbi:MAG: glycosyltransferase, partial [Bacteroidaceae bacterium]|nr:glycosyltransferase [Bacteroidaceae bacterium]